MTPEDVQACFSRADCSYHFARWGLAIAPVVFGVEEQTLRILKGAIEAVVTLADHKMTDVDPELGANLMVFFLRDWQELVDTPHLDRMIPDLAGLVARLQRAEANQYRLFRFDDAGGIRACFVFLRMDAALSALPVEGLALSQMVQAILLWSETAFADSAPLARAPAGDAVVLRPDIAALIRAAYDPLLPVATADPSHALRLFARLEAAR